jgi:hypothetical protein
LRSIIEQGGWLIGVAHTASVKRAAEQFTVHVAPKR